MGRLGHDSNCVNLKSAKEKLIYKVRGQGTIEIGTRHYLSD